MPVDREGRRILTDSQYLRSRDQLLNDVIRYIDREGRHGNEISDIILKQLKKDRYRDLVERLSTKLEERTGIGDDDALRVLSLLLEEDLGKAIRGSLEGTMEEEKEKGRDYHLKEEGERKGLWKGRGSLYLGGRKIVSLDLWRIIRENKLIDGLLIFGLVLMVISSFLFGSAYKAIITGLTLTSFAGEDWRTMLGNISGAIGGILIFFVTISLVFQYLLLIRSRDEKVKEAARKYIERTKE